MRKQLTGLLLGIAMMITVAPISASAYCVFDQPDGTVEVWGTMTRTYTLGEAFRSAEVGLNYYQNDSVQWYGDHLEFWANGNPISDGYKFKEVGQKVITVKRYDKKATYELQVAPALNGRLKECSIVAPMGKTTYRQSVESFDPRDLVVRCVFTDGTTQDLRNSDLEFYAGTRGMAGYKWGNHIKEGYRFVEPGEKDLIVRVLNKEMRVPFTVTPFFTKEVSSVEVTDQPATLTYRVGQGFRAGEYEATCYYADGTTEHFGSDVMKITANGNQIYDGYKFQEAGKKKLIIHIGDYSAEYTLNVTK